MILPGEWQEQAAIILCWPHEQTDWAPRLEKIRLEYSRIIAGLSLREKVIVAVNNTSDHEQLDSMLANQTHKPENLYSLVIDFDDTWVRDFGPLGLCGPGKKAISFRFDGWGGKFSGDINNAFNRKLAASGLFPGIEIEEIDLICEGGNLESNGIDTLMSSQICFDARYTGKDYQQLGNMLLAKTGLKQMLWLGTGQLQGDDTDGHIDTLARFISSDTIIYQACDDPEDEHYPELNAMTDELRSFRQPNGKPYHVHALPWADAIYDGERRLAASYANFLLTDKAVYVPAYGDDNDEPARQCLADALPDREAVSLPCRQLIWQNGSLHCATMQIPACIEVDFTVCRSFA